MTLRLITSVDRVDTGGRAPEDAAVTRRRKAAALMGDMCASMVPTIAAWRDECSRDDLLRQQLHDAMRDDEVEFLLEQLELCHARLFKLAEAMTAMFEVVNQK